MRRLQRARKQRIYAAIEFEHAQYEHALKRRNAGLIDVPIGPPPAVARAVNAALNPPR